MKDELVQGPFGSNACYKSTFEQEGKEVTTWLCFGSGFTTSTVMTEGSEAVKAAIETSPELYKQLMHTDEDGKVWLPATITLPNEGMVFLDGTSVEEWGWTAVKAIPLTEEDKKSGKFPKDQKVKMDMANKQHFAKGDFMDALEIINFYSFRP